MRNSKMTKKSLTSEMDQSVKRMLKLIEEDGDSFAKKAEMYYQKRPELITLVEEFYRLYRTLAERYDHVAGEYHRKINNIPSELQSQGSGLSDISFEMPMPSSTLPSPPDKQKLSTRPRAAGFDFFLGSAGNSLDLSNTLEGDESSSSTLDSENESDDSSVNNYSTMSGNGNGDYQGLRMKVIELEVELRDVKERLRVVHEDINAEEYYCYSKVTKKGNSEELVYKFAGYDQELRLAKEKIWISEEENVRLKAGIAEKDDRLEGLNVCLDALKSKYESMVMAEETDERIDQMSKHLHQLQMENLELIAGREGTHKVVEELRLRVRQLEEEVERQRVVIWEGAEEKREANRQLSFSLEHYRNGYHRLREAFMGHNQLLIMPT